MNSESNRKMNKFPRFKDTRDLIGILKSSPFVEISTTPKLHDPCDKVMTGFDTCFEIAIDADLIALRKDKSSKKTLSSDYIDINSFK